MSPKKGAPSPKRAKLQGRVFGFWTVIKLARSTNQRTYWLCRCTCGNEAEVVASDLLSAKSRTCKQCRGDRHRNAPGESGFNALYNGYRQGAKARDLPFDIGKPEFREIITGDCVYCGGGPDKWSVGSIKTARNFDHAKFAYTGIDRVDSSKGYVKGNCVTCCTSCNRAKWELGEEEFARRIKKIYDFWANLYLQEKDCEF